MPISMPDVAKLSFCHKCGQSMVVTNSGVTHHVIDGVGVDYDQDAKHVALDEDEFNW